MQVTRGAPRAARLGRRSTAADRRLARLAEPPRGPVPCKHNSDGTSQHSAIWGMMLHCASARECSARGGCSAGAALAGLLPLNRRPHAAAARSRFAPEILCWWHSLELNWGSASHLGEAVGGQGSRGQPQFEAFEARTRRVATSWPSAAPVQNVTPLATLRNSPELLSIAPVLLQPWRRSTACPTSCWCSSWKLEFQNPGCADTPSPLATDPSVADPCGGVKWRQAQAAGGPN